MFRRKRKSSNRRVNKRPNLYRMKRSLLDRLKLVGWCLGVCLILVGLYHFFVQSSYFELREIKVMGSFTHVKRENLLKLAQLPYGQNLFAVNLYRIAQSIKRHPWIKHVRVRRRFPHTLSVHVDEYEPIAILETKTSPEKQKNKGNKKGIEYYYMGREGVLFKRLWAHEKRNFPLITGFEKEKLKRHPRYYRGKIKEVFRFLSNFQKESLNQEYVLHKIHYSLANGIQGKVSKEKEGGQEMMSLYFGKDNYLEKIRKWKQFVDVMEKDNTWYTNIDLHVDGKIFARI